MHMDEFDGNSAQVRRIVEQVISTFREQVPNKDEILSEVDKRIEDRVATAFLKFKLWLFGAAIANMIPMAIAAFYLGGIYYQNESALSDISESKEILAGRAIWMDERERWEQAVEAWASPQGFEPPRQRTPTR